MAIKIRAQDGSVQLFPDGTSPAAVRMAMLAYDNKDDWGGLAGRVGEAVGQSAEPEEFARYVPNEVEELTVTAPRVAHSVGHPGFAESLIPVWGSGREAVADFQEGDNLGGLLNAGLAGSDLFLAGSAGKAVAKGGLFALKGAMGDTASAATWKRVRAKMGKKGLIEPGQHGHHWLVSQNGWLGKRLPDWLVNHPLNIKQMPSTLRTSPKGGKYWDSEVHSRIHGRYDVKQNHGPMKERYGLIERTRRGTPVWAGTVGGQVAGRAAGTAKARTED